MDKSRMALIEEATDYVRDRFPIDDYMSPVRTGGAYESIASTVMHYLEPGARILDFGCGPLDKTAVLQHLGFQCAGFDDLQEDWHGDAGYRDRIMKFASEFGIDFRLSTGDGIPFERNFFDMVMLHDVMEHLHDSPRELLNELLERVKPEGYLFITVPNQVNIRKRLDVLRGRTNLTAYPTFYWSSTPWRGHVREYVRDDLAKLADYLNLDVCELHGCDHMQQRIPPAMKRAYAMITSIFPDWKDSWLLVARKRNAWKAVRTLPQTELSRILPPTNW